MKLSDYHPQIKKYNGWFITTAVMASIFYWLFMPPFLEMLKNSGNTLPQWHLFFIDQWGPIEQHPLICSAAAMIYHSISLKFLSARAQKTVNIVFALYIALQYLALTLMVCGIFSDSIFK
jgi:hypothetical protein